MKKIKHNNKDFLDRFCLYVLNDFIYQKKLFSAVVSHLLSEMFFPLVCWSFCFLTDIVFIIRKRFFTVAFLIIIVVLFCFFYRV